MQIKYSSIGSTEPITQAQVKSWLKVDFDTEDTLISSLITQVRELAEEASGLALIDKTIAYFEEDRELISDWITLPYPQHNAITSIVLDGATLATSDYSKTGLTQFLVKVTAAGSNTDNNNMGLTVTYTTLAYCPEGVKLAILKSIAETYEKRGNTFEGSLVKLNDNFYNYLSQFKVY
jgi:uncharacterized phiE125 gp8 family phage protein